MAITRTTAHQHSLLQKTLMEQLNPKDPLIILASRIPWTELCNQFTRYYSEIGRPSKDIRLMIGLLILKQMENLSDERLVVEWTRNPYYQAFCGMIHFQWKFPCDPSDITRFRKRIGVEGCEAILKTSVQLLQSDTRQEETSFAREVVIDSTVQEKAITYPTDSKLYNKVIDYAVKIGKSEGVSFRQTYPRERRRLNRTIRFARGKNIREAVRATRTLHTYAGRVFRELERKLSPEKLEQYADFIANGNKVLSQKKGDVDRIYSLSEPQVACITKGKHGKKHEYGSKASLCMDKRTCAIVGVASFIGNPHDSSTLEKTLESVLRMTGRSPATAFCDRGYRGKEEVCGTKIVLPKAPALSDTEKQRKEARKNFGRRSAIEPVIGHLKSDFRMARNFLKGAVGDSINLIMAAAAFNFRKWLPALTSIAVFCFVGAFSGLQALFIPEETHLKFVV